MELGIQPARFYRWYDRLQTGGPEALEDKSPRSKCIWNRIPDAIRGRIVQLALDEPELSPRELATRFTDTENYFLSEASVYQLLKAHNLITSPADIVMKAADELKDKSTVLNQLWQADNTCRRLAARKVAASVSKALSCGNGGTSAVLSLVSGIWLTV